MNKETEEMGATGEINVESGEINVESGEMNVESGEMDLEESLFFTLERVLGFLGEFCADLALLNREEMHRLNLEQRGVDSSTDVLSFPSLSLRAGELPLLDDYPLDVFEGKLLLGSIAICPEVVEANARELGHSATREYGYMLIHSVLHLLGYDHIKDEDKRQMRAEEKRLCALLGLIPIN